MKGQWTRSKSCRTCSIERQGHENIKRAIEDRIKMRRSSIHVIVL